MPATVKMPTPEDRLCITTMRKSGLSYRDISKKKTCVPLATAHVTVQIVKGESEEAIVCRWELLKSAIFLKFS